MYKMVLTKQSEVKKNGGEKSSVVEEIEMEEKETQE